MRIYEYDGIDPNQTQPSSTARPARYPSKFHAQLHPVHALALFLLGKISARCESALL
jgi:hypothetical protein